VKRALIAVVAAAAIGGGVWMFRHRAPKVESKPVAVATAPLATEVTFAGRAVPRTIVAVQAPAEGTIEAFFVDVGAEVIQGQLLGRVRNPKSDTGVQQAQEDLERTRARLVEVTTAQISARLEVSRADADRSRAQAEVDRLQKAYERQKGLWAAGATARLTYEKSEKDYNDARDAIVKQDASAKAAAAKMEAVAQEIEALNQSIESKTAAIERMKQDAGSGEIHSPADGIVMARHGQPGDVVDPSAKVMEIATELTSLQAIVAPDMASVGKIHQGMPAVVRMGDAEVAGVVQDVQNGQVTVYFNASEPIHSPEAPVQVRIKF